MELDGTAGDLTIGENYRLGMRPQSTGATHIRNIAGNNTIEGFLSMNFAGETGDDSVYLESAAGKLTITGSISDDRPDQTSFLILKGAGAIDLGGPIGIFPPEIATEVLNIEKSDTGTVTTLVGTSNDYTGTTAIHEGAFIMNGTHVTVGSGAYTVDATGTLGGSGTISSTVNLSGNIAPGDAGAVGSFTVGGLALSGGTLDFQLNATDPTAGSGINDLLINTGALI